ncbi:single-stranded DNA-binding protein [Desulfofundulus thermocisternus]|uniref:single-stranded DNA-binding protein n=1 Tax=Desulfofundulus thermocisternus TaxID=42471 RepID=UPI001A000C00|nr:single-stranded DNA-binding protein [Desulfofundulus thermocisternus]MBE3586748.1 single-stranded DNA-binding protein [Thermoanaerobacter sp.]MCS5697032.1 single-stranded DNA-binding protein [Desulfofundulus thermocisternus]
MFNKIILIGRLVREPELRYTPSGTAVARFTLAVDRPFTNRQGEREADFIDIVVWQKQAEICSQYLGKGRLVAVEGRLQIRSYDDSQGVRRKTAEVVAEQVRFLDRPREAQMPSGSTGQGYDLDESGYSEVSFNEDDIPF